MNRWHTRPSPTVSGRTLTRGLVLVLLVLLPVHSLSGTILTQLLFFGPSALEEDSSVCQSSSTFFLCVLGMAVSDSRFQAAATDWVRSGYTRPTGPVTADALLMLLVPFSVVQPSCRMSLRKKNLSLRRHLLSASRTLRLLPRTRERTSNTLQDPQAANCPSRSPLPLVSPLCKRLPLCLVC